MGVTGELVMSKSLALPSFLHHNETIPEFIARTYGFRLRAQVVQNSDGDDIKVYLGRDWVAGLSNGKAPNKTYSMAKKRLAKSPSTANELVNQIYQVDVVATDGKKYKSDFMTDLLLYILAMELRINSERRSDLLKLFANSTKWVEYQAKNPGLALDRFHQAIYEKRLELGDTPEAAKRFAALRRQAARERNELTSAIDAYIVPRQQWYHGAITNILYKGEYGRDAKQLREDLNSPDIRTAMTSRALNLTMMTESLVTTKLEQKTKSTYNDAAQVASKVASFFKGGVEQAEAYTGEDFVTGRPLLNAKNDSL